ncbi:SpaA isopeptide-forming pilin-related protein [Murimonas intestini]|uniref:SdrD B-like protein n=1 Tax=Murimonas intestini TaxID=1337051 RepID=A0AB73T0M9_9FIRM|nr:SpaA isopeptide-forming pilin-related protein [Murimonas intestini]MCR1840196.1 SpaA isopeptide-forming pilin-related protein [Murimonas intestini]MCR1867648.1 SpaA isopeptide-forming pilin-related protein [Murimonas intestini]MCR1884937.1 SpaA isopeptide-forming pilin-related protein [Murimonas intestini]
MENKNRRSVFSIWKRLVAMTLAVLLLVSSDGITSLPQVLASAADTEAVTENTGENEGNAAPVAEIQTQAAVPETQAQTNAPETQSQTSAPETQPQTSAPETQPQTNAPETQPQTSAPETQPQTSAPETQPQTNAPETQPQTNESETQAQTEEIQSESQTESESESESETEVPKAANRALGSSRAAGDTHGFDLTAELSQSTVVAGDAVNYHLQYTVPGGGKYESPTISVTLPKGVSYVARSGGDDILSESKTILQDGSTILVFQLKNDLDTGTGRSIDLSLQVDNFIFADNTTLNIPSTLKLTYTESSTSVGVGINITKTADLTVTADDGWNVKKERVGETVLTGDGQYYDVTYKLTVYNQSQSDYKANPNQETGWNRLGRLDMDNMAQTFSLTDILPTAGVPTGGEAVSIQSVKASSVINEAGKDLTNGSEYTVNTKTVNGKTVVESLTIKYLEMLTAESAKNYPFVKAGTPIKTEYTVVVRYPRAPYVTPSNEELKSYTLENTAQLTYKLIGQETSQRESKANVTLGEKEEAGAGVSLVVKKYIQIAESEILLDKETQAFYGTVSFGLYKDSSCQNVATDVTGQQAAGAKQETGDNGTVTFSALRPGTYYLKEESGIDGFKAADVQKVSIDASGQVTVETSDSTGLENNAVKIVNKSEQKSIVEFEKQGTTSAGEEDTRMLAGFGFSLTNKDDSEIKYEAVSDSDGKVRFENVAAGTYELKEISIPESFQDEYSLDGVESIEITVEANKIVKPQLNVEGSEGIYRNTSNKGCLSIEKVDVDDNAKKLEGAEFNLYGPFGKSESSYSESNLVMEGESAYVMKTEQESGKAVSKPLMPGWYYVKEIKAPENYVATEKGKWIQVGQNTVAESKFENKKKIAVYIKKAGTIGKEQIAGPSLAGAKFEIYDAKEGGNVVGYWVTTTDATGKETSNPVYLNAGATYWYEETKAPEGYTPSIGRVGFTVEATSEGNVCRVTCTNSAAWGQIKIVKENSKTGGPIAGAEFKIFSDEDCQNEVELNGNPVGKLTTNDKGVVLTPLLPVSDENTKYYIKETGVPNGYVSTIDVIRGIDSDGYGILEGDGISVEKNTQTVVTVKNNPLVKAQLTKVDSKDLNKKLQGAQFQLYEDPEAQKPIGAAVTTDQDGVATFEGLKAGSTYYYKETSAPTGYVLTDEVGSFTIPGIDSEEISNELIYEITTSVKNDMLGDLKIQKYTNMDTTEQEGVPLTDEEITFKLYLKETEDSSVDTADSKKLIAEGKTDQKGEVTFSDLKPGNYWLVEVTPDGYEDKPPVSVTVDPGENKEGDSYTKIVHVIKNTANKGKIEIEKIQDGDYTTKVAGAVFDIYKKNDPSDTPVASIITNNNGIAKSGWLEPGDYYMVERSNDKHQAVDEKDNVLKKDGVPYYSSGEEFDFTITAAQTNKIYTGDPAETGSLNSGAIENELMGKLKVNKRAAFKVNGEDKSSVYYPLSGAEIEIYKASDTADSTTTSENIEKDLIADNLVLEKTTIKYEFISDYLPAGKYWVVETEAPENYKLNEGGNAANAYLVTVTAGQTTPEEDAAVTIDNEAEYGKLRVRKVDSQGNIIELPAEFTIYKEVKEAVYNETAPDDRETISDANGIIIYLIKANGAPASSDAEGSMMQTGTAGNGEAVTNDLKPGDTYYLKEISAPDTYFFDDAWSGPYTILAGEEITAVITNYKVNEATGTKKDDSGQGISGAYIGLFDSEADANAFVQFVIDQNLETDMTKRAEIKKLLGNGDYKTDKTYTVLNKIQKIAVTDKGTFKFENLKAGQTYWLTELLPPEPESAEAGGNYKYDTTVKSITVPEDGKISETLGLDFVDARYGQLQVSKTTKLSFDNTGNEEYRVEGVKFNVYEAVKDGSGPYEKDSTKYKKASDKPVASGYTDSNGIYTSIKLAPDKFYIVEEAAAEEYDNDRKVPEFISVAKKSTDEKTSDPKYVILQVTSGAVNAAEDKDGNLVADNKFYNGAIWGRFKLKKVDQADKLITSKITFEIYRKDDDGNYNPYKSYGNEGVFAVNKGASGVGEDGIYLSDYLPAGTYKLVEESHTGYTKCEDIEFTIEGGKLTGGTVPQQDSVSIPTVGLNTPIVVKNIHKGYLELKKIGLFTDQGNVKKEDEKALAGVTFEIYLKTENGSFSSDCQAASVATGMTDKDGKIPTNGKFELDAGNYWLVETSIGEGNKTYETPPTETPDKWSTEEQAKWAREIKIEPAETTSLTGNNAVRNITIQGKFKIRKTDANDDAVTLEMEGAKFGVYKTADCTGTKVDTLTINADGTATSKLLDAGEYYIKETEAPSGYQKNETIYGPYTVTSNTLTDYSVDAYKAEGETNKISWIRDKKLFKIEVTKYAVTGYTSTGDSEQETKSPLSGIKFALYDSMEAAEKDQALDLDGETVGYTESSLTTALTGANGKLTFEKLTLPTEDGKSAQKTYYIREVPNSKTWDNKPCQTINGVAYTMGENTIQEVTVKYNSTDAKESVEFTNYKMGSFEINKMFRWTEKDSAGSTQNKEMPLGNVTFKIYSVADNKTNPDTSADSETFVKEITTGNPDLGEQTAVAESGQLPAGWYAVVETSVNGKPLKDYGYNPVTVWIQVKDAKVNSDYSKEGSKGSIYNESVRGSFIITKYDGKTEMLSGAEFELYKKNDKGGWDLVQSKPQTSSGDAEKKIVMTDKTYESGLLAAGEYKLREIKSPSYQRKDGTDVQFQMPKEDVFFNITAGTTVKIDIKNNPKGSIVFTKKASQYDQNDKPVTDNTVLNKCIFKLYTKAGKVYTAVQETDQSGNTKDRVFTASNGVYRMDNVDPGTYYIHEESVNTPGYSVREEFFKVVIPAGLGVEDKLVFEPAVSDNQDIMENDGVIVNDANVGSLLIKKQDQQKNPLTGAQFEVYAKDAKGKYTILKDKATVTSSDGQVTFKNLPAERGGTKYLVKETKAPDNYTLDNAFESEGVKIEQEVTVYPLSAPQLDKVNSVTFTNKKIEQGFGKFPTSITKKISDSDEKQKESVTAEKSLIDSEYAVDFTLGGYADGKNTLPAEEFYVTDDQVQLYYDAGYAVGVPDYKLMDKRQEDYKYTSVTVHKAHNKDQSQTVSVSMQYKLYGESTWRDYNGGTKYPLTAEQKFDLSSISGLQLPVTGIRVYYHNVQAGFTLDSAGQGISINAVLNRRDTITNDQMPEVRKVTNQANVTLKERYKNSQGKETTGPQISLKSNTVEAFIPTYKTELPTVTLTNVVTNNPGNNRFASGSTVAYRLTASNVQDSKADFKAPMVTFDLAPYTVLNTNFGTVGLNGNKGFRVMLQSKSSTSQGEMTSTQEIPASAYTIVEEKDVPFLGSTDALNPEGLKTSRYAFKFSDDFVLKPGDSIVIELQGIISYTKPSGDIRFDSPAYLGSNYNILSTLENPYGTSFLSKSAIVTEDQIDSTLNGGSKKNEYVSEPVVVYTIDGTGLQLQKSISKDDVYFSSVDTANVNPTDEIYYNLTLYNFSEVPGRTARIADVLPFPGDTYIINNVGRYTDIPAGEEFEEMLFQSMYVTYRNSVTGENQDGNIENIKLYYFVEDSSSANEWRDNRAAAVATINDFLENTKSVANSQPVYEAWQGKWTTELPSDLSRVTAVGAEVTFKQDALLDREHALNLHITMKTPGYTADQIEDYAGRKMVNASVASLIRAQDDGIVAAMGLADKVESNEVVAKLNLPTGSIGDQVFYDHNKNGIQDLEEGGDDERAGQGLAVKLYQRTYSSVTHDSQEVLYAVTETDGNGNYRFDGLPCNYLKKNHTSDMDDPENYVGGEFYEYRVEFEAPEGFAPTIKGAGKDREKDSDVNPDGFTDYVRLMVSSEDGKLTGQTDLSLDAGYIKPYELGNRVWLDINRDGLQNTYIDEETDEEKEEPGVPNVGVKLYKVEDENGVISDIDNPLMTTVTDQNGEYWFRNLPEGYYVVVFDISMFRKEDGYSYQYMFTDANVSGDGREELDSDAMESPELNEGDEDRIRKTKVVHLSYDAMLGVIPDPYSDDRWDAGLTVYSAIGGFCFDDENYTDMQDLYIPLPGTEVELYRVVKGKREAEPLCTATVGEDGRYFFDKLLEGQYQIHFKYPEGYTAVLPGVGTRTTDSNTEKFEGDDRTQGFTTIIDLGRDTVDRTWDAGACKLSSIGDYVWLDTNKNGIQDPDEKGIEGVTVILQSRIDGSEWTTEASTETDQNGKYIFTQLKSSKRYGKQYRVVFVFEEGVSVTTSLSGKDRGLDSDALFRIRDLGWVTAPIPILEYGTSDMTWDAGIVETVEPKGTIGDFVWYDKNRNGIQDEDEVGIGGIEVVLEMNESGTLSNESGWGVYGSTTTNSNGYYRFYDLPSGYYRVRFKIPEEYYITLYNQGTDEELDSDASREATGRWYYSRGFYLNVNVKPVDLSWDAGVYKVTDLTTTVIKREPGKTVINRTDTYKTVTRKVTRNVTRTVGGTTRTVTRKTTRKASKTGDDTDIRIWLLFALLSGTAIVFIVKKKRRRVKE